MTGTADTEATEFKQIYKLDVTVIPPNRDMIRLDHADIIFKSESGKLKAFIEEIKTLQKKGQPVLVGTISVDKSEKLLRCLNVSPSLTMFSMQNTTSVKQKLLLKLEEKVL